MLRNEEMNDVLLREPVRVTPYRFGPRLERDGVTFRLWAPSAESVELILQGRESVPMTPGGDGHFECFVRGAGAGQRYMFRVGGLDVPDPASWQQDEDTNQWSVVVAPFAGRRDDAIIPWREAVICELHVGTATPEGTFKALGERLEHFRDAGYTAIELMPLAAFPGEFNWGYDGVLPYAAERRYGTPEELRALVDRAHELGLAMIADVVYNHFGAVDNFIPHYAAQFFADDYHTPWGAAVDLRRREVRDFFCDNVRMWLENYDFDGLRFDAVHEYATDAAPLFMRELAQTARAIKPNALLILENERNAAQWLARGDDGRPLRFTAQWNDDIHNALRFLATGEAKGYFADYSDDGVGRAARALKEGFAFQGEPLPSRKGRWRGEPSAHLPPEAFIAFIQNHDQIGNQPDGQRLSTALREHQLDMLQFTIMLGPQTPMFFMGEEAQIETPFPFFSELRGEVAEAVRQGRKQQAAEYFDVDLDQVAVPDPVEQQTVEMAKLPWEAFGSAERRERLQRFRELAAIRRDVIVPLAATPYIRAEARRAGTGVLVTWHYEGGSFSLALNPADREATLTAALPAPRATSGTVDQSGSDLRLAPWSASLWACAPA